MKNYIMNVNFDKKTIHTNLQKLVRNDYNSAKINFTFDKEGRVLFKMLYPNGEPYVTQIENNELILTKGILNQAGKYEIEIALYTDDSRMTDYMTASFSVRKELVEIDEVIEGDNRLPILDALIVEINGTKLYLDEVKKQVENGEFNGKDGETPTIGENGNWFIRGEDTGLPSRGERGEKGEKGGVSIEDVEEYVNNAIENIDGGASVTYEFAMTTELPDLDYTVQESYDVELNQDDILQLEEFVNAYAKEKSILNVVVDNIVLWTFSNSMPNIEMLDETNFSLMFESRTIENIMLAINGTFDGTKYTVTDAMLNIAIGDLDSMNERITELENKPSGGVSVFKESSFQPTEQPTGIYFMSDDTSTVEGSSGSGSIRAGTLYVIANDDEYQSKLAFEVTNSEIRAIEGRIKALSGSITKNFYVRFNNFLQPGTAASIYSVYTFSRTPKCTTEPTEDTHLTNKKYVDDAIKAAITTALEGEY